MWPLVFPHPSSGSPALLSELQPGSHDLSPTLNGGSSALSPLQIVGDGVSIPETAEPQPTSRQGRLARPTTTFPQRKQGPAQPVFIVCKGRAKFHTPQNTTFFLSSTTARAPPKIKICTDLPQRPSKKIEGIEVKWLSHPACFIFLIDVIYSWLGGKYLTAHQQYPNRKAEGGFSPSFPPSPAALSLLARSKEDQPFKWLKRTLQRFVFHPFCT